MLYRNFALPKGKSYGGAFLVLCTEKNELSIETRLTSLKIKKVAKRGDVKFFLYEQFNKENPDAGRRNYKPRGQQL